MNQPEAATLNPSPGISQTASGETSWQWAAPDGTRFPCRQWTPAGGSQSASAIILAVHGLGGAGSDFRPLGVLAIEENIAVYAPDLRGQGNDPLVSRRGNIRDLREVVDDLESFLDHLSHRHPGLPLFLYGESMGAMLALHLAARRQKECAGLILASPVIDYEVPLSRWHRGWFNLVRLLVPQWRFPMRGVPSKRRDLEAPPSKVTRDEEHTQYIRTAPHRLQTVTPRFLHSLLRMIGECRALAPAVQLPVLTIYAGHDIFIKPAKVEGIHDLIGSRDRTRRLFPESFHLLLHDHDRAEVTETIRRWLVTHLPPDQPRA